jgi:hypothetical protein
MILKLIDNDPKGSVISVSNLKSKSFRLESRVNKVIDMVRMFPPGLDGTSKQKRKKRAEIKYFDEESPVYVTIFHNAYHCNKTFDGNFPVIYDVCFSKNPKHMI